MSRSGFIARMAAVSAAIGFAGGLAFDYLAEDRRAPIQIRSVEIGNSPIREGERLLVRIWRDKVRDCPVEARRVAVDRDGREHLLSEKFLRGFPVGTRYIDIEYDTSRLAPGQYALRVHLAYICPDGVHRIVQPDTPFRIE